MNEFQKALLHKEQVWAARWRAAGAVTDAKQHERDCIRAYDAACRALAQLREAAESLEALNYEI